MYEPVQLGNDARHASIDGDLLQYPAAHFRTMPPRVPFLAALLDYDDVTYIDLPTGHWPMWSRPAQLAELIARASQNY